MLSRSQGENPIGLTKIMRLISLSARQVRFESNHADSNWRVEEGKETSLCRGHNRAKQGIRVGNRPRGSLLAWHLWVWTVRTHPGSKATEVAWTVWLRDWLGRREASSDYREETTEIPHWCGLRPGPRRTLLPGEVSICFLFQHTNWLLLKIMKILISMGVRSGPMTREEGNTTCLTNLQQVHLPEIMAVTSRNYI